MIQYNIQPLLEDLRNKPQLHQNELNLLLRDSICQYYEYESSDEGQAYALEKIKLYFILYRATIIGNTQSIPKQRINQLLSNYQQVLNQMLVERIEDAISLTL